MLLAGDKTIFGWLSLGRDRNAIDDRLLILGIPAMFSDLRDRAETDPQCMQDYKMAIAALGTLMAQQ